jgi:electron transfer flavoprotein beta subunit
MLNIVVCLKQVPDPEAPASVYRIDDDGKHVICKGAPPVISTYDENALEAALRIKDVLECKITVVSMGKALSKPILKKSLAAGADDLVLLDNSAFADMDGYATAMTLATAIKKLDEYDLVITGMQAADTNAGIVGTGIAELLDIPCITNVRKIKVDQGTITVENVLPDGYCIQQTALPALVTIHKSLGDLRSSTTAALMEAQKRPVTVWTAEDLEIEPSDYVKARLHNYFIPQHESVVEMITGTTPDELGTNLANKLFSIGAIKKS